MSQPRPQPDRTSVDQTKAALSGQGDQRGTDRRGPPSLETTGPVPMLARGFPHPHLGSCPLTRASQPPQCRQHNPLTRGELDGQSAQVESVCVCVPTAIPRPHPHPRSAPPRDGPESESQRGQAASGTQWYQPPPSQHPSLGTQAAGKPGTPPTPASGYPFGSGPRPGLTQTLPRPTPPSIDPPGASYSTPHDSVGARTRGNLSPLHPQRTEAQEGWGG